MKTTILTLMLCLAAGIAKGKTITDMAGRTVEIPDHIERILPYDAKTSILIFPVLEEKMVATSMLPGKKQYQYIAPSYKTMPEVDVKNLEEVMLTAPQVILYGVYQKNDNPEAVLNLGRRLQIPVLMINLSLDKLDEAYQFLGSVFSVTPQCKPLVTYLKKVYAITDSLKKDHPPVTPPVYYAVGPSGLMTDPSGSKHTEVLDFMNIPNAARIDIPNGGHAKVNMEQVLLWNPAYILTASLRGKESAYQTIVSDQKWAAIDAVQQGRIYQVPSQPMGWLDHPPSINRIPGLIWLSGMFYAYPETEVKNKIVEFYKVFYKYTLTDNEYKTLFQAE